MRALQLTGWKQPVELVEVDVPEPGAATAEATLNCRLLPDDDPDAVRARLVAAIADPGITLEWNARPLDSPASPVGDNAMFRAARAAAKPHDIAIHRHGFTHFTLDLMVVPSAEPPPGEGWWQPIGELSSAGLPTLYRRAAEAALEAEREPRLAA